MKNLNVDKAHGWDQLLSVRMIKTCCDAITFPLKLNLNL